MYVTLLSHEIPMHNAFDMWTLEWSMSLFVIKKHYNSLQFFLIIFSIHFVPRVCKVFLKGRGFWKKSSHLQSQIALAMNWTLAQFVPLPVVWRHWHIQKKLQCPIYYKYGPLSKPTHSEHLDTPNKNTSEKSRGDVRTDSREPEPKFPNQIEG